MFKKLTILLTIVFSAVYSKNSWECDSQGKMKCSTDNTCCRSSNSYGWACFPLSEAICCSDGVNVCPNGTICDLSAKTCRQNALMFLENGQKAVMESTFPKVDLTPLDAGNFTVGLLHGIQIFDNAFQNTTCLNQADKLVADVFAIENIIRNFNVSNTAAEIKDILHNIEDLVVIVETEIPVCRQLGENISAVFVRVYQKVLTAKYVEDLTSHTIFNLGKIKELFEGAVKNLNEKKYFDAGRGFGETVKFAALWDF